MNIPQPDSAVPIALETTVLTGPQIMASVLTDVVVAGAYVLVVFIIVYLNRNK